MTSIIDENGYRRLAKAIFGQTTETLTFAPGASVESAVSTLYSLFLQIADEQVSLLGEGMSPQSLVDLFITQYIQSGAMAGDLQDIAWEYSGTEEQEF